MERHKWQAEEVGEYGTKPHHCVKCGIRKLWRGGEYQAWEYFWNTCSRAMNGTDHWQTYTTFKRPECNKQQHHG